MIRFSFFAATLGLMALLIPSPFATAQSETPQYGDYVASDSFFFVACRPRAAFELADRDAEHFRFYTEATKKTFGFDPQDIEFLLIQFAPVGTDDFSDGVCAVLRFSEDVDFETIAELFIEQTEYPGELGTLGERPAIVPTDGNTQHIVLADARTIILACEARVDDCLNGPADGKQDALAIVERLNEVAHGSVAFDIGDDPDGIGRELVQNIADWFTRKVNRANEAMELIESGELAADLTSDTPLTGNFKFNTDVEDLMIDVATGTEDLLVEFFDVCNFKIEMLRDSVESKADECGLESTKLAQTLSEAILENIEINADGETATATVSIEEGAPTVADLFAMSFALEMYLDRDGGESSEQEPAE